MPERAHILGVLNTNISRRDLLRSAIILAGGSVITEACRSNQEIPEFQNFTFSSYHNLLETLLPPDKGSWKNIELTGKNTLYITWQNNIRSKISFETGVRDDLPAVSEINTPEHPMTVSTQIYQEEGLIWEDDRHIVKDQGDGLLLYNAKTEKPIGKLKPEDLRWRTKEDRKNSSPPILASDDRRVLIYLSTISHFPIFVLERENNLLRVENLKNVGLITQMSIVEDTLVIQTIRQETIYTGAGPNQPDRACCIDVHRLYAYRIKD